MKHNVTARKRKATLQH